MSTNKPQSPAETCSHDSCEHKATIVVLFEDTQKEMCSGHAGHAVRYQDGVTTAGSKTKDCLERPEGSETVAWADEETVAEIWATFDTFWISATNTGNGAIHLFEHCAMLRNRTNQKRKKPVSAYPVGWHQPCRHCVYLWEHNDTEEVREVLQRYAEE
jgi:hypothetical protein